MTAGTHSLWHEWMIRAMVAARPLMFLNLSDVATGLPWLCYYRALQLARASLVAPREPLTWRVAMGGVLVASGALVMAST